MPLSRIGWRDRDDLEGWSMTGSSATGSGLTNPYATDRPEEGARAAGRLARWSVGAVAAGGSLVAGPAAGAADDGWGPTVDGHVTSLASGQVSFTSPGLLDGTAADGSYRGPDMTGDAFGPDSVTGTWSAPVLRQQLVEATGAPRPDGAEPGLPPWVVPYDAPGGAPEVAVLPASPAGAADPAGAPAAAPHAAVVPTAEQAAVVPTAEHAAVVPTAEQAAVVPATVEEVPAHGTAAEVVVGAGSAADLPVHHGGSAASNWAVDALVAAVPPPEAPAQEPDAPVTVAQMPTRWGDPDGVRRTETFGPRRYRGNPGSVDGRIEYRTRGDGTVEYTIHPASSPEPGGRPGARVTEALVPVGAREVVRPWGKHYTGVAPAGVRWADLEKDRRYDWPWTWHLP
jgi:hypothetical protein